MNPEATISRKKIANIIRTVIAVSLILFPLIHFIFEIPVITDLLSGGGAETSEVQQASEVSP